jgi:hypothetical protein
MAVGRPRRYPPGSPPKLHNVKCHAGVFDIVRRIAVARKMPQQDVLDRYAAVGLKQELRRVARGAGPGRRVEDGERTAVCNLKASPAFWAMVRELCDARGVSHQVVMDRYAKRPLLTELVRVNREEYAALAGEG